MFRDDTLSTCALGSDCSICYLDLSSLFQWGFVWALENTQFADCWSIWFEGILVQEQLAEQCSAVSVVFHDFLLSEGDKTSGKHLTLEEYHLQAKLGASISCED